ncbi:MAG: protein translocase subunit SecF [Sphaerochaetaceae bacterium]|nr:protein translocase subunit SecF [Sphaerochaetaceae bacterium]
MANKERKVPVIRIRKFSLTFSAILIVISIVVFFARGFNLGIDFESGLSLKVQINNSASDINSVREGLSDINSVKVQMIGQTSDMTYQVRINVDNDAESKAVQTQVLTDLETTFGVGNATILESNFIGAKFSDSLVKTSVYAVLIAMALILFYVWVRFELGYAFSAIIALFHDVICLLGFIIIFRFEISSTTIAAVLTIIGYSLNNTIVIFDRIRETVKTGRIKGLSVMIDSSVGKSLTRTTISSITTMLAVLPLAIFSSGDIKLFAIEMLFGIFIGTYSSNFVAPVFLFLFAKVPGLDPTILKAVDDISDRASVNYLMSDVIRKTEAEKRKKTEALKLEGKKKTTKKGPSKTKKSTTATKKPTLELHEAEEKKE